MRLESLFKRYKALVFFDTETTGLDADNCQIIELAAIRLEQNKRGDLIIANSADLFVKLPKGQKIPENIVDLTGITDEMLEREGVTESEAAAAFTEIIRSDRGRVLLLAHNAQFDLLFVRAMLRRQDGAGEEMFAMADYLDTLTVFKDRRPYPHKLANAIEAYKLEDMVGNTHRAIDDVKALSVVVYAMDGERADLHTYVNVFGYNPKYGVSGRRIDGVLYWPQQFHKYMQAPNYTLPAKVKQARGKRGKY